MNSDQYIQNAVRAVSQKKPVPEIDFTLHTMEDGTQVSTLERVIKGTPMTCLRRVPRPADALAQMSRPPPSNPPPWSSSGRRTTPPSQICSF